MRKGRAGVQAPVAHTVARKLARPATHEANWQARRRQAKTDASTRHFDPWPRPAAWCYAPPSQSACFGPWDTRIVVAISLSARALILPPAAAWRFNAKGGILRAERDEPPPLQRSSPLRMKGLAG